MATGILGLLLGLAGGFDAHYNLLTSTREGDGCTGSSARSPADGTSSRPIHSPEGKLAATGSLAKLSVTKSARVRVRGAHMEHGSTDPVGRSVGTDSGT